MIKIKNVFLWTKERFEEPIITGWAAFSRQGPEQLWGWAVRPQTVQKEQVGLHSGKASRTDMCPACFGLRPALCQSLHLMICWFFFIKLGLLSYSLHAVAFTLFDRLVHLTLTTVKMQNSPKSSLLPVCNEPFLPLPGPGNHWCIFCPCGFTFTECLYRRGIM